MKILNKLIEQSAKNNKSNRRIKESTNLFDGIKLDVYYDYDLSHEENFVESNYPFADYTYIDFGNINPDKLNPDVYIDTNFKNKDDEIDFFIEFALNIYKHYDYEYFLKFTNPELQDIYDEYGFDEYVYDYEAYEKFLEKEAPKYYKYAEYNDYLNDILSDIDNWGSNKNFDEAINELESNLDIEIKKDFDIIYVTDSNEGYNILIPTKELAKISDTNVNLYDLKKKIYNFLFGTPLYINIEIDGKEESYSTYDYIDAIDWIYDIINSYPEYKNIDNDDIEKYVDSLL